MVPDAQGQAAALTGPSGSFRTGHDAKPLPPGMTTGGSVPSLRALRRLCTRASANPCARVCTHRAVARCTLHLHEQTRGKRIPLQCVIVYVFVYASRASAL